MAFNVMEFLRPRKQAKVVAVSKLAERLHAGEQIDPDLILHSLEQAGASEQQLQAEIDRLERVAKLRQQMADAVPAQKRLDAIEAEISKAADKLQAAALEVQRVREKHLAEASQLEGVTRAAEDAATQLMRPANMTGQQQEEWRAIQDALAEANEAHSIAVQDLKHAQERMEEAEIEQPKAAEQAKLNRNTPHVVENSQRWDNAKAARTKQLEESHAGLKHAAGAVDDAQRSERVFRASILEGAKK
jgi:chromosome segregation ATPase